VTVAERGQNPPAPPSIRCTQGEEPSRRSAKPPYPVRVRGVRPFPRARGSQRTCLPWKQETPGAAPGCPTRSEPHSDPRSFAHPAVLHADSAYAFTEAELDQRARTVSKTDRALIGMRSMTAELPPLSFSAP
jgi:hypothetical protein